MALQEEEVLANVVAKLRVECSVLPDVPILKNWKGNFAHRSLRWLRRNTNLGKVCIQLLYFVLITRLAYLVPLGSGFDVLALR